MLPTCFPHICMSKESYRTKNLTVVTLQSLHIYGVQAILVPYVPHYKRTHSTHCSYIFMRMQHAYYVRQNYTHA